MYHNFLNVTKSAVTFALFLLLLSNVSVAQNKKKIDSLEAVVEISSPENQINALIELAFEALDYDLQKADHYVERAYDLAWRMGDSVKIVTTGRIRGQLLRRLDRLDESLEALNKVRPIAKRNLDLKRPDVERNKLLIDYKRILNALALGYAYKASYDEALKYNFESLVIREAEGNKGEISITLNNIGLVYFKLGNAELAMDYYSRSLNMKKESGDPNFDLDILLMNMGLCYNLLEKYDEAQKFIKEAFEVCGDKCSKFVQIEGKFGQGIALFKTGEPKQALTKFEESFALANESKDRRFQLENLLYLARVHDRLNDPKKTEDFLKQAESLAVGTEYNQLLIYIYKEFSDLYRKTKRFEDASTYQHHYIHLKDSIIGEKLIQSIAEVQTKYEERENLKTIAAKDAVLALKEEILKRKSAENSFYIVVTIMVFTLAILMLILFRLTRRANERLEERVDERTKDLNNANDELKKVNGEMDNFIYKTSHDIRGPLASLKGICNVAIMDVKDDTALTYLKKLDNTAEKLNTILTRLLIINQINHAMLAANVINFEEIIEDILFLERKKGMPRRLDISYEIKKGFAMKSDREMLRIVLENLIDNSIKFYNESDRVDPFVKIDVSMDDRNILIKVIDNGVGINDETKEKIFQMFVRASERSETGGIGLYLSKLATERLGGSINFSVTPEKHTLFTVRLPLDLGPILELRNEQEKIRDFEKRGLIGKQKPISAT